MKADGVVFMVVDGGESAVAVEGVLMVGRT